MSNNSSSRSFVATGSSSCTVCKGNHKLYKCDEFKKLTIYDRFQKIKKLGRCFNCLEIGHLTSNCTNTGVCFHCKAKHHTLLHIFASPKNDAIETGNRPSNNSEENVVAIQPPGVFCGQSDTITKHILLSTAVVQVFDVNGQPHYCRTLLDSASQSNFITQKIANLLNLQLSVINIPVKGINEKITNIKQMTTAKIKSIHNNYHVELEFLVVDKITGQLPARTINVANWKIPQVKLADTKFYVSDAVDMLLGAELFFDLLTSGRINMGNNLPLLQNTQLGWIITGKISNDEKPSHSSMCHLNILEKLDNSICKFWEIEGCDNNKLMSHEEQLCENIFATTHIRNDDGRFVVTYHMIFRILHKSI